MKKTENKMWAILCLYAISILTIAILLSSCKSTKHFECDAYKTHYKALKPERHKSHHNQLCDAYN